MGFGLLFLNKLFQQKKRKRKGRKSMGMSGWAVVAGVAVVGLACLFGAAYRMTRVKPVLLYDPFPIEEENEGLRHGC